jgi:carbon storage regulator
MLVLSRKPGEKVVIGNGISVTVVEVKGNRVWLGIDAPDQVHILRGEIACWHEDPAGGDQPTEPGFAGGRATGRSSYRLKRAKRT